jgi:hypothetical protein
VIDPGTETGDYDGVDVDWWPGRADDRVANGGRYCSNASTISGSSFVTPLAVQVSIVESV